MAFFPPKSVVDQRWKEYLDKVHQTKLKRIKPTLPHGALPPHRHTQLNRLASVKRNHSGLQTVVKPHKRPQRNYSYHRERALQRAPQPRKLLGIRKSVGEGHLGLSSEFFSQPQFILKKGKFLGDSYWVFEIRRDVAKVYVNGYDAYGPGTCAFRISHQEFQDLTQTETNYEILFDLIDMKDHAIVLLSVEDPF